MKKSWFRKCLGRWSRRPAFVIIFVFAGFLGPEFAARLQGPVLVYQGLPEVREWSRPRTWYRVLRNEGFTVGYSDLRGNPLWVSYRLFPVTRDEPGLPRLSSFSRDWRNFTRISHADYRDSGFDRGHLAPNYAISRLYGKKAQEQTFLMTNVSPQRPRLNQKVWQRIEEAAVKHFASLFGEVWVVTGPIFHEKTQRLKSSFWVEVPSAFYKIFFAPSNGKGRSMPRVLAFLVPQTVRGNEPLDRFLVTVREVEGKTGLDFFPDLDAEVASIVEAEIRPEPWRLKQVARLPARY